MPTPCERGKLDFKYRQMAIIGFSNAGRRHVPLSDHFHKVEGASLKPKMVAVLYAIKSETSRAKNEVASAWKSTRWQPLATTPVNCIPSPRRSAPSQQRENRLRQPCEPSHASIRIRLCMRSTGVRNPWRPLQAVNKLGVSQNATVSSRSPCSSHVVPLMRAVIRQAYVACYRDHKAVCIRTYLPEFQDQL